SLWRTEARERRAKVAAPVACGAAICWLYLPILFQVMHKYVQYSWETGGSFWANPVRIFLPWFPLLNADHPAVNAFLRDNVELVGNMSPGWTIAIPAAAGLFFIVKNRMRSYLPLVVLLLLFLLHNPVHFAVLKAFPWYREARVFGRFSLIFPVIMPLVALAAWEPFLAWTGRHRWLWAVIAPVVLLELFGVYSRAGTFEPMPAYKVEPYMAAVRNTPGAALLDWPFCIAGGNGVGTADLCPFYNRNQTTYGLERWHQKKLISAYLGKLTHSQIKPFVDQGWPLLFERMLGAESSLPIGARSRFGRCPDEEEWAFLIGFLKRGDFAGVQLYSDLAGKDCAEEFHRRIGPPSAFITLPVTGPTEFIPRPAAWRALTDEDAARSLHFSPPIKPGSYNLMAGPNREAGHFDGMTGVVEQEPYGRPVRRIIKNDAAQFVFVSSGPRQPVELTLELRSGLDSQPYEVLFNGLRVASGTLKPLHDEKIAARVTAVTGENSLFIHFTAEPSFDSAIAGFRHVHGQWSMCDVPEWYRHWSAYARGTYAVVTGFRMKVGAAAD
ncbi:MAG: hypothetical protein WC889_15570, partial [Myxococcota bacterium]